MSITTESILQTIKQLNEIEGHLSSYCIVGSPKAIAKATDYIPRCMKFTATELLPEDDKIYIFKSSDIETWNDPRRWCYED